MIKGGWLVGGIDHVLHVYPSEMAQNFWTAIWAFSICLVLTIIISLATRQLKTTEQLKGLVYSLTPRLKEKDVVWYNRPQFLAIIVLAIALVLSIVFW
jgi:SSS family solute:Na+ symporter